MTIGGVVDEGGAQPRNSKETNVTKTNLNLPAILATLALVLGMGVVGKVGSAFRAFADAKDVELERVIEAGK